MKRRAMNSPTLSSCPSDGHWDGKRVEARDNVRSKLHIMQMTSCDCQINEVKLIRFAN